MPVEFTILPQRGLVYVCYQGEARVEESFQAIGHYARHPDYAPGQKQLVDLSAIHSFERDYVNLFKLQAEKADLFMKRGGETLILYYAPTDIALQMSELILRSWDGQPHVIPLVQQNEADALALLGQPERSISSLLENVPTT